MRARSFFSRRHSRRREGQPNNEMKLTRSVRLTDGAALAAYRSVRRTHYVVLEQRREAILRGTLVLAVLTVRSSYQGNREEPCQPGQVPDTLQWWIGSEQSWRIKTFAMDHDIHTHSTPSRDGLVELARANNSKHYADVLAAEHVLEFADCTDEVEVGARFHAAGLEPRLEVADGRFAFWRPDAAEYRTQSSPERS